MSVLDEIQDTRVGGDRKGRFKMSVGVLEEKEDLRVEGTLQEDLGLGVPMRREIQNECGSCRKMGRFNRNGEGSLR